MHRLAPLLTLLSCAALTLPSRAQVTATAGAELVPLWSANSNALYYIGVQERWKGLGRPRCVGRQRQPHFPFTRAGRCGRQGYVHIFDMSQTALDQTRIWMRRTMR